jgi:hypothetical protein
VSTVNLFKRTIVQLDALVVFLALERDEVFSVLKQHEREWLPEPEAPYLPGDVNHYRLQVCHAAFLLGYSYIEAFLADLSREIYARYPQKLSPDKEVKYKELVGLGQSGDVFGLMIEREIRAVFARTMTEILEHMERRLDLPTSSELKLEAQRASLIRNCLLHNGATVERALAAHAGFALGAPIRLNQSDVHHFGAVARQLAGDLWETASAKYFNKGKERSTMGQWVYKATPARIDYQGTENLAVNYNFLCRSAYTRKGARPARVREVMPGDIIHFYYRLGPGQVKTIGSFVVIDGAKAYPDRFSGYVAGTALVGVKEDNKRLIHLLEKDNRADPNKGYVRDPVLKMFTGWALEESKDVKAPLFDQDGLFPGPTINLWHYQDSRLPLKRM